MNYIIAKNLKFHGDLFYSKIGKINENLNNFNYKFIQGKTYLINSDLGHGGWALSWILGGHIKKYDGVIEINNNILRKEGYCIGLDHKKKIFNRTVKKNILLGLKRTKNLYFKDINEVINLFNLSLHRLNQPLYRYSGEIWRASIAIGLVNGKNIFCFPWINPSILKMYEEYWIKNMLLILKEYNAIVIMPSRKTNNSSKIFDEIIDLV